ncbi:MAG TPA: hypothetical protein VFP68_14130 [Burkholderiaceae bacterium]|nr:hypothetical protein [Burkholderiaceae bacterium]
MNEDDPDLSRLLRAHATRHRASGNLRAHVRTQIALADAAQGAGTLRSVGGRWWSRLTRLTAARWPLSVAAFIAGMLCMGLLLPVLQRIDRDDPLEGELVADHVRALKTGALVQVASTDRHTIKPWFQGRIDYAPRVFDLSADGFPLLGGRVEAVRGMPAATIVYARRRHIIDVFIVPGAAGEAPLIENWRGFTIVRWTDGVLTYWAVSDADRSEIGAFLESWKAALAKSE